MADLDYAALVTELSSQFANAAFRLENLRPIRAELTLKAFGLGDQAARRKLNALRREAAELAVMMEELPAAIAAAEYAAHDADVRAHAQPKPTTRKTKRADALVPEITRLFTEEFNRVAQPRIDSLNGQIAALHALLPVNGRAV